MLSLQSFLREGRVVGPCWEKLKPKGPKGRGHPVPSYQTLTTKFVFKIGFQTPISKLIFKTVVRIFSPLEPRFQKSGFRTRFSNHGFKVPVSEPRFHNFGFKTLVSKPRSESPASNPDLRALVSKLRFQSTGFKTPVSVFGFRNLGFRTLVAELSFQNHVLVYEGTSLMQSPPPRTLQS